MSNVVLAILTRPETAPTILAGAARLAELLHEARIEAMVTRILPISTILPTEEILSKVDEKKIHDGEVARATALKSIFDGWSGSQDTSHPPKWIDEEGITEDLVKTWGERVDYIVVGQPETHAHKDQPYAMKVEHDTLHAALFASERPVLMMPFKAKADFGRTIAIAWREDKFTLHALLAALQLVPHAEQVHLLMGHRDEHSIPKVPEVLAEHDVPVTTHALPIGKDAFGAQLLATAHELKADLLVMGAFVHNRWHNLLFGGVTQHILTHADIPVLMRHS